MAKPVAYTLRPMTIALIVIGVIAFLAIDAYIIFRVLRRHRAADDFATFAVPGEATVAAMEGTIRLTYQESYRAPTRDEEIQFGVPDSLEVVVTGPAGEPVEIKQFGFMGTGQSLTVTGNTSRAQIGTVDVTSPGTYVVKASGAPNDAIEPQILVGK
jgi:hypothetical protein